MNSIAILRPTNCPRPIPRHAAAFALLNYAVAIPLLTGMLIPAQAQTTFTKITTGPVVTDGADGEGCAWVDFDNDGDLDLLVTCDGPNLLYRNDGNGVFTKITTGPIVNAGAGSESASWADFDNDGLIDLLVSRHTGPALIFHQQPDGTFAQSTLVENGYSGDATWADYDNDGFVDVLIAGTPGNVLWQNNGHGGFVAVTNTPFVTAIATFAVTWADYDNDGDLDVFVGNQNAESYIYRNDGHGVFTRVTQIPAEGGNAVDAAWGDYDNDGFPDLFIAYATFTWENQKQRLYHNNGNGTFTRITQGAIANDSGVTIGCTWGDYDNDGWLDLFVTDFQGQQNRLYHNNGDGTFTRILSGSVVTDRGSSTDPIWGDYDRDGFLDLFVANGTNGGGDSNDYLYHNDGNSNAWITVNCVGTRSNRSAIGAKIRVKATINGKTLWQTRAIGVGGAGNPLEAHFGLGDATNIETLRIEWSSGTVQEFQNVAAKQFLTITEPSRLVAGLSNCVPQFTLQGGRSLQYDVQTSTNLADWSLVSTLVITNLNGTGLIMDTNTPGSDQHFYRAVLH